MSIVVETLYFIGSYTGIVLILFIAINWLSKGWLWHFLRVKSSKGKKVLCAVYSPTDVYYKAGHFQDNALTYKSRDGENKTLSRVTREHTYNAMGVFCIDIDEVNSTIFDRNKNEIKGNDAGSVNSLLARAMYRSSAEDLKHKIIMIMLALILLVAIVAAGTGFYIINELNNIALTGVIG